MTGVSERGQIAREVALCSFWDAASASRRAHGMCDGMKKECYVRRKKWSELHDLHCVPARQLACEPHGPAAKDIIENMMN